MMTAGAFAAAAQSFTGSVDKGVAERGKTATGRIVMSIPDGLHVNSNRPSSPYAIATSARVTATGGARAGAVAYPRGKNRKFQFSEESINVYEGQVTFKFPVRVPANFRGPTVSVRATIRYQACTDEVCYPPRSKTITINARVR